MVDVVCWTDKLSENVVDLVSAVVIPLVFDADELCGKKQATKNYILQEVLYAHQYTFSTNKIQTKIDKQKWQ